MSSAHAQETARMMIQAHGLHAQAIALLHVDEMRQQNNTLEHDRWQQVHVAICELRHTAGSAPKTA